MTISKKRGKEGDYFEFLKKIFELYLLVYQDIKKPPKNHPNSSTHLLYCEFDLKPHTQIARTKEIIKHDTKIYVVFHWTNLRLELIFGESNRISLRKTNMK